MDNNHTKRLRVFAGPNGSGKTTLARSLSNDGQFKLKVFVSADEIESEISTLGYLTLSKFHLKNVKPDEVQKFIRDHGMSPVKSNDENIPNLFDIKNDRLFFAGEINSYIAYFLRTRLLSEGVSFAFETVFSHNSKLDFMIKANQLGYKVYFYFLATDDPEININRVDLRVAKKGHAVAKEKITQRYYRSLNLMFDAVKTSWRAYLFDNSGEYLELVAKVNQGKDVEILDFDKQIPNWFIDYFFRKSV